ncbi:DUF732 domain-containing protein [Streptomyces virginiae]|uniref:DUF732 domain-containing protein n=1 Tax=Streptomyces virginiae TaxID=1961 RepID=UPI003667B465
MSRSPTGQVADGVELTGVLAASPCLWGKTGPIQYWGGGSLRSGAGRRQERRGRHGPPRGGHASRPHRLLRGRYQRAQARRQGCRPAVRIAVEHRPRGAQLRSRSRSRRHPAQSRPRAARIYLAALNTIDPEIVNGKDDKAVSRGLSQCQSMNDEKDPTKRVESTNRRFISPNHPDGFGPTKAAFILAAVQTNLCPTY